MKFIDKFKFETEEFYQSVFNNPDIRLVDKVKPPNKSWSHIYREFYNKVGPLERIIIGDITIRHKNLNRYGSKNCLVIQNDDGDLIIIQKRMSRDRFLIYSNLEPEQVETYAIILMVAL